MKRQTRKQVYKDLANAVGQMRRGEKVKRVGAKDGSIRTHAVVPVDRTKLEADVLADCLVWLVMRGVFCQRHDAGTFQNDRGQWGTYGIKNAGDIIGILKPNGHHIEIETKRGSGGRLSEGQQKRMKDVREFGGLYFVCHGVEELEHFMGEWI